MYLKRIVLHGFKSFADRTEFDFGPGITCVVGPNGCGKSNVLDAVRWVLGEQSAKSLRGRKMADVIFSGSRSRKPANAAHVELTFQDCRGSLATDENEVRIARVLYRSGDSEYRLNGASCRLKDIRHLFLDTGVGVDAYSIIEQGRVDMLLQADPLQRREIFEEAAGISRYKVQRAEAQRKLERTQNNLLRLNDVIDELEKRLRSVKLAAGKARRWQEHDHRLRELRASFSLAEYHELQTQHQALAAQLADLAGQVQELQAELARHDAHSAELEHALQEQDAQVQAADARLAALQSEQSALEERIAQSARRIQELQATRQRREAQVAEIETRIVALDEQLRAEHAGLESLRTTAAASAGRIGELQRVHGEAAQRRDDARAALERARTAVFEAARAAALLRNEQTNLATQRQRLEAQAQRLAARREALSAEQAEQQQQEQHAAARAGELEAQTAALAATIRDVEADLARLAGEIEAAGREIAAAKEQRSAVLSRLELLEDLEQRREGVDQGTQSVLAWRDEPDPRGTVLGLVADLLRIDDPRIAALQPVLATFENHVVVQEAHAFLAELARRGGALPGPVRVMALDRLPAERPAAQYEDAPGVVARAADWVNCPPELRPLAEHLLGRVIVVDALERALALAGGAPHGYLFATLDGQIIAADGRITVGGAQASPGLISRKAQIRQLHLALDELETQLEHATRQRSALEQQRSDAQLRHGSLLSEIAAAQKEHAEARTILTRLAGERTRTLREAEVLAGEIEATRRALAELDAHAERLAQESAAAGETQQSQESQTGALGRELEALEQALAGLAADRIVAKVQAGRASEKLAAEEEALARRRNQLAALAREQEAARQEAAQALAHSAAAEAEHAAAQARAGACAAELEEQRGAAVQLREQRQATRSALEGSNTAARGVGEQIRTRESEAHAVEVTQREVQVRCENLVARVQDELQIDLVAGYAAYQHAEQDWEAVKAEIAELREKLARLGSVNLDAIVELEELTPRFENLTLQRTDLEESIARLNALIVQLDEESQTRFAATFAQIRENFQALFRKLFGGGKADVLLEQPDQPLESGIEIIARPPGKETQSISLLSGGEKTMTAVALVMAVFQSKPSPFAFLDEVDAALDEANTERFNSVLSEFLAYSQFVVITHSKRTMQAADVLYGVTMEEPGVSQRVSVRFDDLRVQAPHVA